MINGDLFGLLTFAALLDLGSKIANKTVHGHQFAVQEDINLLVLIHPGDYFLQIGIGTFTV